MAAPLTLSNDTVKETMAFMKDLYDQGCITLIAESYGDQTDFGNYKTLFTIGSSSGLPYYDSAVKSGEQGEFVWGVAPLPYMDGGDEPVMNLYGASVTVPKTTPEQELAAWLFTKWFTEPEQNARWAKISGYFPVRNSAAEAMADYFEANPVYKQAFDLLPYSTYEAQWCACYEEVRRMMNDAYSSILDGADIDATLAALEADSNVSLMENTPEGYTPEEVKPEEPEEPAAEGPYDAVDPTGQTVLWWHQHTKEREEGLQEMVQEFNSTNEWGIEVVAEYAGGYGEIYDKMIAAIAADDPTLMPNLTVGYANQVAKYQLAEALVDMDYFVDSPAWGLTPEEQADFPQGIFEADVSPVFGDGHFRMGFPPNRSMEVMYYNMDWLMELGYDGPPTTWAEFAEIACAATDPDAGTVGYEISTDASRFASLVFSRHGSYFMEDGSAFDFGNDTVKESMAFMKDLYDQGCITLIAESYGDQTDFGNYKTLFTIGSSSGLPYYDSAVKSGEQGEFVWGVAPLPYMDGGDEPVMNLYGASVTVPKTTPEQELAAWLFTKWFTEPEQNARWAKISGYFPVRNSAAEAMADYFEANPVYKQAFDLLPYSTYEAQWCACYEEVRRMMNDAYSSILDGADIDETLAALEADSNVSLLENTPEGYTPEEVMPEEPEEPAGAGGTFIFGRGGDSVQLDPAIVTDGESFRVTGQCLEPLYQYEPGSTTPIPALATDCTPNDGQAPSGPAPCARASSSTTAPTLTPTPSSSTLIAGATPTIPTTLRARCSSTMSTCGSALTTTASSPRSKRWTTIRSSSC